MLVIRLNQLLRRHLDAEVHHSIPVVAQNDLDQVLADIMDVALYRGQNDLAPRRTLALLHELLEMIDGSLHRLCRLQHLGDNKFVVIEEASNLAHSSHQRTVDHIERRHTLRELRIQIGN